MAPNTDGDVLKKEEKSTDTSLLNGRFLAHPPEGEEICITGQYFSHFLAYNQKISEINLQNRN